MFSLYPTIIERATNKIKANLSRSFYKHVDTNRTWRSTLLLAGYSNYKPFLNYSQLVCCYSVTKSCLTLCNPMDCSASGFPVLHYLPEFAKTHVHWVSDAIQPSHPLRRLLLLPLIFLGIRVFFQWVVSSHQVAKVLELQLQLLSFQWIFRVDFL